MSPDHKSPVRTFRQRGAFVTGWFLIAVFGVVLVAITASEGSLEPSGSLLLLAVIGAVYLLLVRPAVRISADGVRLENILHDVDLSWPSVDLVESRWNLKVVTPDGKAYSSWAISAQRPKMTGGVSQTAAGSMVPTGTSAVPMGQAHKGGSAGAVADAIDEAKIDYQRAVDGGHIEPQQPQVRRRPSRAAAGGWVAVLLAAVLGIVLL